MRISPARFSSFIRPASAPANDLIEALTLKFRDSDGDLAVVVSSLVADDRARRAKPAKLRNPLEFVVGAARATGFAPSDPGLYLQALNLLGMPLGSRPAPTASPIRATPGRRRKA